MPEPQVHGCRIPFCILPTEVGVRIGQIRRFHSPVRARADVLGLSLPSTTTSGRATVTILPAPTTSVATRGRSDRLCVHGVLLARGLLAMSAARSSVSMFTANCRLDRCQRLTLFAPPGHHSRRVVTVTSGSPICGLPNVQLSRVPPQHPFRGVPSGIDGNCRPCGRTVDRTLIANVRHRPQVSGPRWVSPTGRRTLVGHRPPSGGVWKPSNETRRVPTSSGSPSSSVTAWTRYCNSMMSGSSGPCACTAVAGTTMVTAVAGTIGQSVRRSLRRRSVLPSAFVAQPSAVRVVAPSWWATAVGPSRQRDCQSAPLKLDAVARRFRLPPSP